MMVVPRAKSKDSFPVPEYRTGFVRHGFARSAMARDRYPGKLQHFPLILFSSWTTVDVRDFLGQNEGQ